MHGRIVLATAAVGGALALAACGSSTTSHHAAATAALLASGGGTIAGTWVDTVTPNAPIAPFQSTIIWTDGGAIVEATSKANVAPVADVSGGLGVWKRDGSSFDMTFQKYLFNSSGSSIGRTVIVETDSLQGDDAYSGHAVATIYNPAGGVVTTFNSTTHAVRMPA